MQPSVHACVHPLNPLHVEAAQSIVHAVMFDAGGDGTMLAREILRKNVVRNCLCHMHQVVAVQASDALRRGEPLGLIPCQRTWLARYTVLVAATHAHGRCATAMAPDSRTA